MIKGDVAEKYTVKRKMHKNNFFFLKTIFNEPFGTNSAARNEWKGAKLMSIVLLNLTSFEF